MCHQPKFLSFLFVPLAVSGTIAVAATTHQLDIGGPPKVLRRGHLDLGGKAPHGQSIEVNSCFIEVNGKPSIPIIGEFHYSRVPAAEWEESLRKMKAGGITVVATYVFWNLHEREQGKFDWSGDLDVRRCVEVAGKAGLNVILRVGPFAHGEIRNGGLPDWVYGLPLEVRSNDPGYLDLADKLYGEIGQQVRGLFFKDGGPIIGVQLENEFQHSGAPWDIRYPGAPITYTAAERDEKVTHAGVSASGVQNANVQYGRDHMANLKLLAKKNGLEAPLYTATGWGNAAIVPRGSLPVTAAYPYPFWTPRPEASPFYLFKDLQKFPDYPPASYETDLYPSLPAELGAGISTTYTRRSYVPEESVAPMIVRVLGSGSNGIGYYMYHGGATPVFDKFYNEDAGGLPKINYDYQAPLGQYGRPKAHHFDLRPLHLFIASYGAKLAPLPTLLPAGNAEIKPADSGQLRFAARAAEGSGFVFLLNYQDHVEMRDLPVQRLVLRHGAQTISIPTRGEFVLKKGATAILPVNLDLDGVQLRSATVQPLTILRRTDARHFVFFSIEGLPPELALAATNVTDAVNCQMTNEDGLVVVRGQPEEMFSFRIGDRRVLVLPQSWARQALPIPGDRLLFTSHTAYDTGVGIALQSFGETSMMGAVYPAQDVSAVRGGRVSSRPAPHPGMSSFRVEFAPVQYEAEWEQLTPRRFVARFDQGLGDAHNVFMKIPYVGDSGMAFINGHMVDDDLYFGRTWEIGLKRFLPRLKNGEMVFVFQPMMANATYLQDIPERFRPTFEIGRTNFLKVDRPLFVPEYRTVLLFD